VWPQTVFNKSEGLGEVEDSTKILICWQKAVLLLSLWNMLASLINSIDEHNSE
jgi:hypothetical protein